MSNKPDQFVMITRLVLDSKAWRTMSLGARVLYIAFGGTDTIMAAFIYPSVLPPRN
jgi:hypothetical protein